MKTLSAKEKKFIITHHLALKDAEKSGIKIYKAQIYKEVFECPNISSTSATNSANKIIKKFKSFPKNKQELFLREGSVKAEGERLEESIKRATALNAYNEGLKDANRKFDIGFEEGKKVGKEIIKMLSSSIDLSTKQGRLNFKEHLATIFLSDYNKQLKFTYHTEEGEYITNGTTVAALIKGLLEIAKLNEIADKPSRAVEEIEGLTTLKDKYVN